jgi:thiol-disulfide isomerase/thioredoxin
MLFSRLSRCSNQALVAGGLVIAVVSSASGCSGQASGRSAKSATARLSAEEVLQDMVAAYRAADSYADSGELELRFRYGQDQNVDERVDFAVTFVRPNKLRMHFYQAIAVCDATTLHATVADLDKQVLKRRAPAKLSLEFLYADDALRQALTEQIAGSSPQLALLLGSDFLNTILSDAKSTALLPVESIDDEPCDRVRITRDDGDLVFWIAQATKTLKRIEFPTRELKKQLDEQVGSPVSDLQLWANLRGARLNPRIDDVAFQFEVPADAKIVDRLDLRPLMPPPPEPSKLLGQKIANFTFTRLDGSAVTPDVLKGKVAVIDFWATWCGPCLENLPHLNRVYEKYKNDDRVEFLAVSVDQPDVKPDQLRDAFAKIGASVPIARDNGQSASQAFQVEGIPNLFIVGPDGTIEDNEVGMNPALADELPQRLQKLLSGQSIHADARERYAQRKAQYEAALKEPLPPLPEEGTETPQVKAEIAPQSEPTALKLTPLWNNTQIKQPGNVLTIENSDGTREILVHDGWRKVVRLDQQGTIVGEHELEIPQTLVVSYLRSSLHDGHRWFAGSASTQRQLYLFDTALKPVLGYPSDQAEVCDVQFVSFDGAQPPLVAVSYWGTRGVELIDLEGNLRWKAPGLENVFRLAEATLASGEKPKLLAAHGRGSVAVFDAEGKTEKEIAVDKRFIRAVYAADLNGDGVSELCALAPIDEGRDVLLGLDAAGNELWSYDLPPGVHEQPIEHLTSGQLLGQVKQWIICAADGSIHVLSADGKRIDRFNFGAQLTGIAVMPPGEQPTLLVASTSGVTALRVESK